MKKLSEWGMWVLFVMILLFSACKKDSNKHLPDKTFLGEQAPLGNGSVRSFVTVDGAGKPKAIGMKFTEAALQGLPTDTTAEHDTHVPLPADAPSTGFDHLEIDWNPVGHEPKEIYGLPHFDFHFYIVTAEAQAAVIGGPDTVAVPAKFVPLDYLSGVMAVPDMGVHWFDTKAPEFSGKKFDDSFIYGFYHGAMTFVEPMATTAFIATKSDFTLQVKQPESYQKAGYYPTIQHLYFDQADQEYNMVLEKLVFANASY